MDKFVKSHGVECEWTPRDTYDVCLSQEFKAYEDDALRNMRAAGGNPEIEVMDEESAKNVSSSFMYPASGE